MRDFALALSQVTSNISRSLGAGEIEFIYQPKELALPAPPGVESDDYRIDVAGFRNYVDEILPIAQTRIRGFIIGNQENFNLIPRATITTPGWSGQAREYAQDVVVPRQTEHLMGLWDNVAADISLFMTKAKDGTLSVDAAGATG